MAEFFMQIIDVDYMNVDGKPVVRIFGRCDDGKTACVFVKGYNPYFYILPMSGEEEALKSFLEKKFNDQVQNIEEVEKFLPFGYSEKPSRVLKVTGKDPSQIPVIRDEVWKEGLAKKIFEADILFKYRYMADANLHGMRWYRVVGNPVSTSVVKVDRVVEMSCMEPAEDRPSNLKIMAVDIEISTPEGVPNSRTDPIIMISLAFMPDHGAKKTIVLVAKQTKRSDNVMCFDGEKEMLEELVKIIDVYNPDIVTGYNINNFDLPYILERLTINGLPRTLGRCNLKPVISKKLAGKTRSLMIGRIIADDYDLIKEMQTKTQLADKGFPKLKRYSLDDVSKALINDTKVNVLHKEIPVLWSGSADDILRLAEYARKDAELALRLLVEKNLLDKFFEISKVSGVLMQDVLDGGEATRVENILLREFNKRNFLLPLKPSSNEMVRRIDERDKFGFKGALVLEPVAGLHTKPVVYLDFKSMYPTIFISFNICPTTLVTEDSKYSGEFIETPMGAKFVSKKQRIGIVPQIVEHLIMERDRLRKEAKTAKDDSMRKILESKQIAVKYMTNSFYGYTGYIRSRTYSLPVATAVTACGRMLIERTRNIVSQHSDMTVVYGDTDSIMVKVDASDVKEAYKIGQELEREINKSLEGLVEMKIENVFKSLLILSKKRYAGISVEPRGDGWEEKIVMKGIETVRRDWCDLTGETLKNTLNIILREQNPKKALAYIKEIIMKLGRNEIPVEKLVVTKSISKSLKEYKGVQPHIEVMKKMKKRDPANAPGVGDRIGYVIVNGTQMMSMRAEDPEFVKSNKMKIDSKYYIENQILPPLERVFEAIGISKTEILGAGKMLTIMEAMKNAKSKQENKLESFDGVVCDKCNQSYRRPPIIGKCDSCGGQLSFFSGDSRSKIVVM
jgi:DNA polymerase I